MGRELQKKKNRSSLPKVRRKAKSKKKILSNPIIAANWNQKETLSQNYKRLGLTSRLNSAAGGTEKFASTLSKPNTSSTGALAVTSSVKKPEIVSGEVRVERDPDTGKILRVVAPESKPNPLNDPLNELDDSDPETFDAFAHVPVGSGGDEEHPVIAALEAKARNGAKREKRKLSQWEEEWIERLVQKYGDDYRKMSRDVKLNPYQETEGEIKRKVKRLRQDREEARGTSSM